MKVIFLGTSSDAGKTTIAALYCRYLSRKGVKVAPFKAMNLSSFSYSTEEGEIGIGQALQAWLSGIRPAKAMNPILLKPLGGGKILAIVNGEERPYDRNEYKDMRKEACKTFDRLSADYDTIVCEGSGSPVELNNLERDIANTGMMRERGIPAVLVGDIERGGCFAALYGTWMLMPEDVRPLLKGFIINRFRGDPSILWDAIERIKDLTGMEFIGIMPYMDLNFPKEDALSSNGEESGNAVPIEDIIKNADALLDAAEKGGFDFKKIEEISSP